MEDSAIAGAPPGAGSSHQSFRCAPGRGHTGRPDHQQKAIRLAYPSWWTRRSDGRGQLRPGVGVRQNPALPSAEAPLPSPSPAPLGPFTGPPSPSPATETHPSGTLPRGRDPGEPSDESREKGRAPSLRPIHPRTSVRSGLTLPLQWRWRPTAARRSSPAPGLTCPSSASVKWSYAIPRITIPGSHGWACAVEGADPREVGP